MKILQTVMKNYKLIFYILLLLFFISNCSSSPQKSTYNDAETAYREKNLKLSRKHLENVLSNTDSSTEDKVKAAQLLATQDWKFYRNYNAASERIKQAVTLGKEQCVSWQIMSGIAMGNSKYMDAMDAAKEAIKTAENSSDKLGSKIILAGAIHYQAINTVQNGKKPDRKSLDEAHRLLTDVLANEPMNPNASKLLLGISLIRRDGQEALKAWRYYFMIPEKENATGLLAKTSLTLSEILPKWQGQNLSQNKLEKLVLALAQSRFFGYANIIASELESLPGYNIEDHPSVKEVILYAEFIEKIRKIINEYYLRIALSSNLSIVKKILQNSYRNSQIQEAENFYNQLPVNGEKPKFTYDSYLTKIRNLFGAVEYDGPLSIMGHCIEDKTIEVEQYGHKVDLHYVILDSMVSRDYTGWFLDADTVGGWAGESQIVRIRRQLINEPFFYLKIITDPKKLTEIEKEMEPIIERDEKKLLADPYAFIPGFKYIMHRDVAKQLYISFKTKGYKGSELCIAFIKEYLRLKEESLISHESRHAIDLIFYPEAIRQPIESEFRAKLSEFTFTSNPKFAFFTHPILESEDFTLEYSPHTQANKRIIGLIVKWMGTHIDEISGIDKSRPLLPQSNLLSNDQIKSIFIEADPMAKDVANKVTG